MLLDNLSSESNNLRETWQVSLNFRGGVWNMKEKVVLLSTVHDNAYEVYMPLSILALGSALQAAGYEAVLLDVQVERDWEERLRRSLEGALLFGVSCLTSPSIRAALRAIEVARQKAPGMPVVWGGYHATLAHTGIMAEGLVDYVVRGQGDGAIVALAEAIAEAGGGAVAPEVLARIPNLVFRDGSGVRVNPLTAIDDMNGLPRMDYSLANVPAYFQEERRYLSYVSSYGCPWSCTFCAEPTQSLRRWKPLAAKRTVEEVAALWETYGPTKICFMDPNFSTDAKRVVEIVEEMEAQGLRLNFLCDMRARDVLAVARRIDLRRLCAVGFREIYIGIESGSDRVLADLRKGLTAGDALQACQLLDAAGIQTDTTFIHDLPGETEEDSDQTFQLLAGLCQLEHNRQFHHFYMPFPSTAIYDRLVREQQLPGLERTQEEWARSSTYHGSQLWPGRLPFRKRVLRRLLALKKEYPGTFQSPSTLPTLQSFQDAPRLLEPAAAALAAPPA
jgi:anaerobic magnesium-protoporphyrin IX monomethyl ester cyclase